jgi:HlyD family secretion protein
MKKRYIVIVLIILIAAFGFFYYQNSNQIANVEYITVQRTDLVNSLRASGVVKPEKTINLSSTIAENIKVINFKEGDIVNEGDVLIEFDDSTAQANYKQALAQLNSAKASLEQTESTIKESEAQIRLAEVKLENAKEINDESLLEEINQAELEIANAKEELERRQYLYENGAIEKIKVEEQKHRVNVLESNKIILEQRLIELKKTRNNKVKEAIEELKRSEIAYQSAQKQYHVAEENVNSAQADLNRAEVNLEKYIINSPIDGKILTQDIEVSEYIQPGQTLLTLGSNDLQIEISPDEKELNLISIGDHGYVSPDAYPNRKFEVEIVRIASSVDPDRGTIDVYLKPVEDNEILIPNMSVSVEVVNERIENIILIPENYVREDNESRYVYIYNNGTAQRKNITLEESYQNEVVVSEGLNEEDRILRPENITDGQAVEIGSE